ncbi:MAG: serine hydrolase domain-containing protein [Blastocatellia bacterium]
MFGITRWLGLVCLVALLASGCHRQATRAGSDSLETELDRLVPALLKREGVPGVSLAVIKEGEVILAKAYGLADKSKGTPARTDTRFNIGSVSKTVTAWAALTLVEKRLLDLDAPVERYLKRWRLPPSDFDHAKVTVRRVLSHTAGLSVRGYHGVFLPGEKLPTLEESLAGYSGSDGALRVSAEPGAAFRYSSGGYTLLQLLIEEVSGEPFAAYARRAVFEPLGMTSARYEWTAELQAVVATPYKPDSSAWPHYLFVEHGSGGVYLTATDLARLVAATIGGRGQPAGRNALKPETVQMMIAPAAGTEGKYGLGYKMMPLAGEQLLSHDGANEGWRAMFLLHPHTGDGVVILTNSDLGGKVMGQIACVCFARTRVKLKSLCAGVM